MLQVAQFNPQNALLLIVREPDFRQVLIRRQVPSHGKQMLALHRRGDTGSHRVSNERGNGDVWKQADHVCGSAAIRSDKTRSYELVKFVRRTEFHVINRRSFRIVVEAPRHIPGSDAAPGRLLQLLAGLISGQR